MGGIELSAAFHPQEGADGNVVSLFNKIMGKIKTNEDETSDEEPQEVRAIFDLSMLHRSES